MTQQAVVREGIKTFFMEKDPDSVLDYGADWSLWLGTDTISVSAWSVSPSDSLVVTTPAPNYDDTQTVVWLAGGVLGTDYQVTNHITTDAGRQEDCLINFHISDTF